LAVKQEIEARKNAS